MTQQYLRQFGKNTICGPPTINELMDFSGLIDYKKLVKDILSGKHDFEEEEYRLNMMLMDTLNQSQK